MSPSESGSSLCLDERLWRETHVDLDAFKIIISSHFHSQYREHSPMNEGAYARVFLFTLQNDVQVVGRILLPVRETIKTEAEVAAMEIVRAKTSIPVPKVYLYCCTPRNPVGAEWILMEYLPGRMFRECFEALTHSQKLRTATDLAEIISCLFSITASHCGSLLQSQAHVDDQFVHMHPSRYPFGKSNDGPALPTSATVEQDFRVGPINDITLLDYPNQVPPQVCGPFLSERQFLEVFAFRGIPGTRPDTKLDRWSFEKVLEVYEAIRPSYRGFNSPSELANSGVGETFHFAHGDLSTSNILIDPETGAITGVIDWEMAGFRPAWLAAVAAGWFDDDSCRFLMVDDQSDREGYDDESAADAQLRAHFRLQLALRSEEAFRHHWLGVELRAIFYACCNECPGNSEGWLLKYEEHEWDVGRRGPFPFDLMSWIIEKSDFREKYFRPGSEELRAHLTSGHNKGN